MQRVIQCVRHEIEQRLVVEVGAIVVLLGRVVEREERQVCKSPRFDRRPICFVEKQRGDRRRP